MLGGFLSLKCLELLPHVDKKKSLMLYEAKIVESNKAGSHWESEPGHLACAASALPLSYDNWTTTSPHNPLDTLHR